MAIVMEKHFGPGQGCWKIDDSCCVKTKEEQDKILQRLGEIYYNAMLKKYLMGELTNDQKENQNTENR